MRPRCWEGWFSRGSLFGLQMTIFSLCPHMGGLLCVYVSVPRVPLMRTPHLLGEGLHLNLVTSRKVLSPHTVTF